MGRNENCLACSRRPQKLEFPKTAKLQEVVDHLVNSAQFQMRAPGLTTSIGGKNKTLYMQSVPSIEAATKKNLKLTLADLGLVDGSEIVWRTPPPPPPSHLTSSWLPDSSPVFPT